MSVQNQTSTKQYVITTVGQSLAVPFYFLENNHLKVIKTALDGSDVTLVLDSDYTVTGAGVTSGGLIALSTGSVGETITITRSIPITQLIDYIYNDAFPADTHEKGIDKLTMICQQLSSIINLCIKIPESDSSNMTIPASDDRAGFIFEFDSNGLPKIDRTYNSIVSSLQNIVLSNNDIVVVSTKAELDLVPVTSLSYNAIALMVGYNSAGDGSGGFLRLVNDDSIGASKGDAGFRFYANDGLADSSSSKSYWERIHNGDFKPWMWGKNFWTKEILDITFNNDYPVFSDGILNVSEFGRSGHGLEQRTGNMTTGSKVLTLDANDNFNSHKRAFRSGHGIRISNAGGIPNTPSGVEVLNNYTGSYTTTHYYGVRIVSRKGGVSLISSQISITGYNVGSASSDPDWAGQWTPNTAYSVGDVVQTKSNGNFLECVTAGTSRLALNGPNGFGIGIQDGTVVWKCISPIVRCNFNPDAAEYQLLGRSVSGSKQTIQSVAIATEHDVSPNNPTRKVDLPDVGISDSLTSGNITITFYEVSSATHIRGSSTSYVHYEVPKFESDYISGLSEDLVTKVDTVDSDTQFTLEDAAVTSVTGIGDSSGIANVYHDEVEAYNLVTDWIRRDIILQTGASNQPSNNVSPRIIKIGSGYDLMCGTWHCWGLISIVGEGDGSISRGTSVFGSTAIGTALQAWWRHLWYDPDDGTYNNSGSGGGPITGLQTRSPGSPYSGNLGTQAGSYTFGGRASQDEWTVGEAISIGDKRNSGSYVYEATSSGTTGSTPPTGTGTGISDGGVTWDYETDDFVININELQWNFCSYATIGEAGGIEIYCGGGHKVNTCRFDGADVCIVSGGDFVYSGDGYAVNDLEIYNTLFFKSEDDAIRLRNTEILNVHGGRGTVESSTGDRRFVSELTGNCRGIYIRNIDLKGYKWVVYLHPGVETLIVQGIVARDHEGRFINILSTSQVGAHTIKGWKICLNEIEIDSGATAFTELIPFSTHTLSGLNISMNHVKDSGGVMTSSYWITRSGTTTGCVILANTGDVEDIDLSSGSNLVISGYEDLNAHRTYTASSGTNPYTAGAALTPLHIGEEVLNTTSNEWWKAVATAGAAASWVEIT